jgi:DNA-3-methyladenine glycosylase II
LTSHARRTRPTRTETAALIASSDPAFGPLIAALGPPPAPRSAPVAERFGSLARAITFQMLATRAAETIHERVLAAVGDMSPEHVLEAGTARLRDAGLSGAKASALIDLASRVRDGSIRLDRHGRMPDEDVTRELTTVRGVGAWTTEMYLIFTLARRDVWPVKDLAVRYGWTALHALDEPVGESELRRVGERFAGVRSAVAYYCWRANELARRAK